MIVHILLPHTDTDVLEYCEFGDTLQDMLETGMCVDAKINVYSVYH